MTANIITFGSGWDHDTSNAWPRPPRRLLPAHTPRKALDGASMHASAAACHRTDQKSHTNCPGLETRGHKAANRCLIVPISARADGMVLIHQLTKELIVEFAHIPHRIFALFFRCKRLAISRNIENFRTSSDS